MIIQQFGGSGFGRLLAYGLRLIVVARANVSYIYYTGRKLDGDK